MTFSKTIILMQKKKLSGDQLAIGKETGRRLGMGTNMYPSSSLLGDNKDQLGAVSIDDLIENADGFAGVFPGKSSKQLFDRTGAFS